MNIKKIMIASSAILAMGVSSALVSENTEATSGSYVSLSRNAYVYNSKGIRIGKSVLKKGTKKRFFSKRTINHNKFYKIGKNTYIKVANAEKPKENGVTAKLKHNAYVYNSKGISTTIKLAKGKQLRVYDVRYINHVLFLEVGPNQWIKAGNVANINGSLSQLLSENNPNIDNDSKSSNSNYVQNTSQNSNVTITYPTNGTNTSGKTSTNNKPASKDDDDDETENKPVEIDPTKAYVALWSSTRTAIYDSNLTRVKGVPTYDYNAIVQVYGAKYIGSHLYWRVDPDKDYWIKDHNVAKTLGQQLVPENSSEAAASIDKFKVLYDEISKAEDRAVKKIASVSTPSSRSNYNSALKNATSIARDRKSSDSEIAKAINNLTNAVSSLDGKFAHLYRNQQSPLTEKQKSDILQVFKRATGYDDATFYHDRITYKDEYSRYQTIDNWKKYTDIDSESNTDYEPITPVAGKTIAILKSDTNIFDSNGSTHYGEEILQAGTLVEVTKKLYIKNQLFYQIGENRFIQAANVGKIVGNDLAVSNEPAFDQPKIIKLNHSVRTYDQNGSPIYGPNGVVWYQINAEAKVNIGGEEFYRFKNYQQYANGMVQYVKVEDTLDNAQSVPVASAELKYELKNYLNGLNTWDNKAFKDLYELSDYSARNAFDAIRDQAYNVLNNQYLSDKDISKVKAELVEAYNKLDGKRIEIDNPMTPAQKQEVLDLVNKVNNTTNAALVDHDTKVSYNTGFSYYVDDISKYTKVK